MQSSSNKKLLVAVIFVLCFFVGFGFTWLLKNCGNEKESVVETPESQGLSARSGSIDAVAPDSDSGENRQTPEEAVEDVAAQPSQETKGVSTDQSKERVQSSKQDKENVKTTELTQTDPQPKPVAPLLTKDQMKKMLREGLADELVIKVIGLRDEDKGHYDCYEVSQCLELKRWSDIEIVRMTDDSQGRITSVTIRPVYPPKAED